MNSLHTVPLVLLFLQCVISGNLPMSYTQELSPRNETEQEAKNELFTLQLTMTIAIFEIGTYATVSMVGIQQTLAKETKKTMKSGENTAQAAYDALENLRKIADDEGVDVTECTDDSEALIMSLPEKVGDDISRCANDDLESLQGIVNVGAEIEKMRRVFIDLEKQFDKCVLLSVSKLVNDRNNEDCFKTVIDNAHEAINNTHKQVEEVSKKMDRVNSGAHRIIESCCAINGLTMENMISDISSSSTECILHLMQ